MDILIKKEATTARKADPNDRTVEELIQFGCINLDKPPGPTSHQVSDFAQQILNINKAGHGGSLDPKVTGVLPIALQRATRLSHVLLKGGKEYVVIIHLHKDVDEKIVREVLNAYIGKITQMPPIKSAVKRQEREREIYFIKILEIEGKDILLKIGCEAGTYIRKYAHDLGQKLGVGAHMADLRRTRASCFTEENLITLQDLKDAFTIWKEQKNEKFIRHCIKPAERMVDHLPKVWVFDSAIESITHGRDVSIPGISKLNPFEQSDMVAIMSLNEELVALGIARMNNDQIMEESNGSAVNTHKVFME